MNILEYLKIKSTIESREPEFEWCIKRWSGCEDTSTHYTVSVDDGGQTYHTIYFDKNKYDLEDVFNISYQIAKMLKIEFLPFDISEDFD